VSDSRKPDSVDIRYNDALSRHTCVTYPSTALCSLSMVSSARHKMLWNTVLLTRVLFSIHNSRDIPGANNLHNERRGRNHDAL
jgi:hypothetical protein